GPGCTRSASTSRISSTCGASAPRISGRRGPAPVAIATMSARAATTSGAVGRVGALSEPDLNPQCGEPIGLPVQVFRVAVVTRGLADVAELAAELLVGFPKLHLHAAFASERRQLHARRAAADHEQPAVRPHAGP